MIDLKDKVVLVTGAGGRGHYGRCVALQFANQGARVILVDIEEESASLVKEEILATGGEATFIQCDIRDEKQVAEMVEKAAGIYGGLHVLVNGAFVFPMEGKFDEEASKDWDDILNTNLKGHMLVAKYCIPHLLKNEFSSVVNISSISSLYGEDGSTVFSIAKAGENAFTKSLATQYGRRGLRVNAVVHGFIVAPEFAHIAEEIPAVGEVYKLQDSNILLPRHGNGNDVADAVVFLARAEYITGQILVVDGGFSVHPPTWSCPM